MKAIYNWLLAALMLLMATGEVRSDTDSGAVPDSIVVKFKSTGAPFSVRKIKGRLTIGISEIDELLSRFEAEDISVQFPGVRTFPATAERLGLSRVYRIKFPRRFAPGKIVEAFSKNPQVEYVQPIGIEPLFAAVPNDPYFPYQWGLSQNNDRDVDAPEAWELCRGHSSVVLAVADTGVDWQHPDLGGSPPWVHGNIWTNWAEYYGVEGLDDDGNGYDDDVRGWDWVNVGSGNVWPGEDGETPDNDPMDFHGHGTHCAGIVSAITDNGTGVAGLGWGCQIMPLRVGYYGDNGYGYVRMDYCARAIIYATDNGATAINCSWGSSNSGGIADAVDYAVSNGVLVVVAAGNSNNSVPAYLSSRGDCFDVAATDSNDTKPWFSNYGSWVDVSAPGVGIYSTYFDYDAADPHSYAYMSGTSMAAPHVVGLIGLVKAFSPALAGEQIRTVICDTCDNIDSRNPGYVGLLGSGRINAHAALRLFSARMALVWSTFLGGSGTEYGRSIAVDSSGYVYVTGQTTSTDFPVTSGAFDEIPDTKAEVFVTKLLPSGAGLEYSTYLGGRGTDQGKAIACDSRGCVYVSGITTSPDFPITPGAFDAKNNRKNKSFVAKLDVTGTTLEYSTYLGGSSAVNGVQGLVIDSSGCAYVTGYTESTGFPITPGAFDETYNGGQRDVFISKLNSYGTGLEYSTFLGGNNIDEGYSITLDSAAAAYVTGYTSSSDFPTTSGAFDRSYNGGTADTFVAKLDAYGAFLDYSTLLGGDGSDLGEDIAVDSAGCAYVSGYTSSPDLPTTFGAFDESYNAGGWDVFVTKFNPDGTALEYCTYLGGSRYDLEHGYGIAVDSSGCAYVTGESSSDFPTTYGAFDNSFNQFDDVFFAKFDSAGSNLICSTYLGGSSFDRGYDIAVDSSGCAYVVGQSNSSHFPTTVGAFQESLNGGTDGFIAKFTTRAVISGTVTFEYPGWATEHYVRLPYQVKTPGIPSAPPLYSGTVTVCLTPGNPASGNYGIVEAIPDGTYDVALKHANHLADMKTVTISGVEAKGIDFTLWAGDADGDDDFFNTVYPDDSEGDNDVDFADYYTLAYQYAAGLPLTTGYNADFDDDGNIDLDDYYGLCYGYQNAAGPGSWFFP